MKKLKIVNDPPVVYVNSLKLSCNQWHANGFQYDVANLIQATKELNLITFDMPLAAIDLSSSPLTCNSIEDMIFHCRRVQDCDLKYPIILDDHGYICDGWHRVIKSILEGKKTIKAYRLQSMPNPSGKYEQNNN